MENLQQRTDMPVPEDQREVAKKSSSRLLFMGIVIVFGEVLFFLLFFFLFLSILNYFNILRIDYAFPFLSFLPRQNKQTIYTQLNPANALFVYDKNAAQKLLLQYVKENVQNTYVPNKLFTNQNRDLPSFISAWQVNDISQTRAFLNFSNNSNTPVEFGVHLVPKNVQNPPFPASQTYSQAITSKYLKNIAVNSSWRCDTLNPNTSYCEDFTSSSEKKYGYGIGLIKDDKNQTTIIVFACTFLKENTDFVKKSSCLSFIK